MPMFSWLKLVSMKNSTEMGTNSSASSWCGMRRRASATGQAASINRNGSGVFTSSASAS